MRQLGKNTQSLLAKLWNITIIPSVKQSSLNFVFINGRGSSGKDTQADLMVEQNPYAIRISTGNIYRGAKTQEGQYARFYEQIKPYIESADRGGYIPDEVILPIVNQVIENHIQDEKDTFIFTGFPRTVEQLRSVDEYTQSLREKFNSVNVDYVCYAVLEEHSKRRAKNRLEKAQGEGTPIRRDDDPNIVLKRLQTYKDKTEPMLHLLVQEKRLLVIKSSGTIEDVRERTIRALGKSKPDPEINGNLHKER